MKLSKKIYVIIIIVTTCLILVSLGIILYYQKSQSEINIAKINRQSTFKQTTFHFKNDQCYKKEAKEIFQQIMADDNINYGKKREFCFWFVDHDLEWATNDDYHGPDMQADFTLKGIQKPYRQHSRQEIIQFIKYVEKNQPAVIHINPKTFFVNSSIKKQ